MGTLLYLQNFKSIHAKLKKIDLHMCSSHRVVEIQAVIYNVAVVRRLFTNFKSVHAKLKRIDLRMHSCAKP